MSDSIKNSDSLNRFLFENAPLRGEFVHLDQSFRAIIQQHAYPPPLSKLLGEALCAASLLSAIIKFNGRLTVQFRGNGKLKFLLAQCNNHAQIRGLVKWEGEVTYEDIMDDMSQGLLVIILDSGVNQTRYQGIVSWRGHSLISSIEGYFQESEQLKTKIWLAVDDTSAAGLLLQMVPALDGEKHDLENTLIGPQWDYITQLASQITPQTLLHQDYPQLLSGLFPDETIRVFSPSAVTFHCTCSRKRGERAIALLGREEAEDELKSKQNLEVTCDFCNKKYIYDRVDVAKIFQDQGPLPSDIHLH